jgi:hypothetical protein
MSRLTITGLPSEDIRRVYVFSPGTDITYEVAEAPSANEGYLAMGGAVGSDGVFILYLSGGSQDDGFTGDGSYPVLLHNNNGSPTDTGNPWYARAAVTFSNGTATVSYASFTAVVSDGGGMGRLTVTGLPSVGSWEVYIFSPGTDISTYDVVKSGSAINGSYEVRGSGPGLDEAFILYPSGGSQGGGFTGDGSYPVLLMNTAGSDTDTASPMYAQAAATFSGGTGMVSYGSFTAVVATVVDAFSLNGKLTAPVTSEAPEWEIDDTQYTGYISWRTSDGAFPFDAFAASTVYQVELILNAKPNYIFTDVGANSFTHTGATTVTTVRTVTDRKQVVITITFPVTGEPRVVSAFALDGKVTAPVTGGTPDTTEIDDVQYTGYINWQASDDGAAPTGAFAASTVYQAVLTLTAKTGWTFEGVAANSFTYTGATAVSNAADSGTVTITFPATEASGSDTVVTDLSLDYMLLAPVYGATGTGGLSPVQYTGTIAWKTSGGAAHTGAFAASTVYQAVLTLTARTGYTFTGVAANSFTYTGATTVSNAANSGTVTITFPATAASGASAGIQLSFTGPVNNDITVEGGVNLSKSDSSASSITISVGNGEDYDSFRWLVDGADLTGETGNSVTLEASNYDAGAYWLMVIAKKDGVPYSREFIFLVAD